MSEMQDAGSFDPRTSSETPSGQVAGDAIDLSLVVVSHNSSAFLEQNLSGACRLVRELPDVGVRAELIIVDNASEDDSVAMMRQHAANAHVIELPENVGYGAAANIGAEQASGEWLAVLNPDVSLGRIEPPTLAAALNGRTPRNIGVLGPAVARPGGAFEPSVGFDPTLFRMLLARLRSRANRKYVRRSRHRLAEVDWVTGACIFVRREAWQAVGGFDAEFFLYYDEVDLCRRIREAGFGVRYDPSIEVEHQAPYHSRPRDPRLAQIIEASRSRYFAKHRPGWEHRLLRDYTTKEIVAVP